MPKLTTGHKLGFVAHVLALSERPFTRWHELNPKEQANYQTRAKRLVELGAEYDPIISDFMAPACPRVSGPDSKTKGTNHDHTNN